MSHSPGLFRLIFFFTTVTALTFTCLSVGHASHTDPVVGTVYFTPKNSRIYFEDYDFTLRGYNLDGVTYFFLPSFIQDLRLDYSSSGPELFREDGELYIIPAAEKVESVLVGQPTVGGGDASCKIVFFFSENLYTMDIELEDTNLRFVTRNDYSTASVKLISPSGVTDCCIKQALIKGRGNTTWDHEKRPYDIKFPWNIPVAGLWPCDSWSLLANHYDPTKMRHRLAFDIADAIGLEDVTGSEWIDLYIDGDYRGNYLVCNEPEGLPGGYLIEANATPKGRGDRFSFEIPSGVSMTLNSPAFPTKDDKEYITTVTDDLDDAIHNDLPEAQYRVLDRYSFARMFLVDEISLNADIDFSSHFYYTEPKNSRMYAGPLWDYDKAFGYSRHGMRDWNNSILSSSGERLDWQDKLMEDKEYYDYAASVFSQNEPALEKIVNKNIDDYYRKINASTKMDRIRWTKRLDDNIYKDTYNDIRYLKFFLSNRLSYLSGKYSADAKIMPADVSTKETHELTLNMPDGSVRKMDVTDGTLLTQDDLPPLTGSDIWCFDFYGKHEIADGFIPVFEDATLTAGTPVSEKPDRPLPKR